MDGSWNPAMFRRKGRNYYSLRRRNRRRQDFKDRRTHHCDDALQVDFKTSHYPSRGLGYSTAVSCNISPLAKRAGLSTSILSTTFVVPRRIKSAKIFPVAGACITPCPLKPLAQYKPRTSGTGPRIAW